MKQQTNKNTMKKYTAYFEHEAMPLDMYKMYVYAQSIAEAVEKANAILEEKSEEYGAELELITIEPNPFTTKQKHNE